MPGDPAFSARLAERTMPHAEARFFRTVFTGLTGFARCRQQRKPQTTRAVYQKAGRGGTPRRPPARNPRDRLEPVREPVRPDIAAALRESPQHPVRDMAARVQARGGLAHRQAGEPLDLPRVRHGRREPTSTGSQGARSGSLRTGLTQSTGNGTCRPSSWARRPIGLGAAAYGAAGLKEGVGSKGKGSDGIFGAVDQRLGVAGVLGEDDARARLDVKSGEQQGMAV